MDPKFYKAVIDGNIAFLKKLVSSNSIVLLAATTHGDNILHVAAKYDKKQVAEEILELPQLVQLANRKNSKGDTPLHIAARMGSLKVAEVLIKCAKNSMHREIEEGEKLTRIVNKRNDTALHDAVRNGCVQVAKLLIQEDPQLTGCTNVAGESPLFIAVDKQHFRIAKLILDHAAEVFSIRGRNGMNVFHAAVIRSPVEVHRLFVYLQKFWSPLYLLTDFSFKHLRKLLSIEFSRAAKLAATAAGRNYKVNCKDLVECLMKRCESALTETDECGWTPLHYAAHFGAVDIFELFSKDIHNVTSAAYIKDKEGMSVIHMAAREGQGVILKKLSKLVPDIWDLQDNKGQTALHLAIASGQFDCVKFILDTELSHNGLINQQDNEGNTALHLAVTQWHHGEIFELLINDSKVDKTITNKEGFTAFDIFLLQKHTVLEKTWITMTLSTNAGLESLENAINTNARKMRLTERRKVEQSQQPIETRKVEQAQQSERRDPAASDKQVEGQQLGETELVGLKKFSYDQLQKIASTNSVVATLIATVSFAAGFTMPGGYRNDGQNEGMAILSRESAFRVSVIANVIAFCFSTTSMILHNRSALVQNLDVFSYFRDFSSSLTSYAITAMVIAFLSGTYASLADTPGLAKAVLAIGSCCYGFRYVSFLK